MYRRLGFTFWIILFLAGIASAADVETAVSTRETYVGLPIVFQIQINNAHRYEEPTMPEVDGLVIESLGSPSRSSQTTIINGRKSERSSVIFRFRVTPEREGEFTIPPIRVVTDGIAMVSKAVRIVASKSEPTELLLVEVAGKEQEIFVGEALNLTLKIWIRPYRDPNFEITLDEANMWRLISEQTSWGPFAESLREMEENNQRPDGNKVLRKDTEGNEREYILYEIDATVYPKRPGQIDADDVRIVVSYPLELGRSRSPFSGLMDDDFPFGSSPFGDSFFRNFGSSLRITRSKPLVAEATVEPIAVKPIPEEGRPDDYRGAVGQYSIITQANPTQIKVGDPVNLLIAVDGTGPMDLVRSPPIESQQSLTDDFRVPDEPLAGFVDGDRKVFSTTIRPSHEGVTEIPPISFSYFDPKKGEYVSTKSDPIPLQVEKADVLALDAIVGGRRQKTDRPTDEPATSTSASTSKLAFLPGPNLLEPVPRPDVISTKLIWTLAVPPGLAFVVLLFSARSVVTHLTSSRKRLQRSLRSAKTTAEVGDALEQFLIRRFCLTLSRQTRSQTIGQLRAAGHHDLAIRTERLYTNCEKKIYSPTSDESLDSLKDQAAKIADELGRMQPTFRPAKKHGQLSSTSVLLVAALWLPVAATDAYAQVDLSPPQQQALLDEAMSIYASLPAGLEPGTWNEDLARVREKLQLLVDSGVRNDRIYFNLGTAHLRLGEAGKAIASFRRALRLDPTNQTYRERLAAVEQTLAIADPSQDTTLANLRDANDQIQLVVSPQTMKVIFVSAWVAFWGIIALRTLPIQFHWKTAASLTLLLAILAAGSYFLRVTEFVADGTAVLIEPKVIVRSGDGAEFAEVTELRAATGRIVQVLDRRNDWIHIALQGGNSGWIPAHTSEEI